CCPSRRQVEAARARAPAGLGRSGRARSMCKAPYWLPITPIAWSFQFLKGHNKMKVTALDAGEQRGERYSLPFKGRVRAGMGSGAFRPWERQESRAIMMYLNGMGTSLQNHSTRLADHGSRSI